MNPHVSTVNEMESIIGRKQMMVMMITTDMCRTKRKFRTVKWMERSRIVQRIDFAYSVQRVGSKCCKRWFSTDDRVFRQSKLFPHNVTHFLHRLWFGLLSIRKIYDDQTIGSIFIYIPIIKRIRISRAHNEASKLNEMQLSQMPKAGSGMKFLGRLVW